MGLKTAELQYPEEQFVREMAATLNESIIYLFMHLFRGWVLKVILLLALCLFQLESYLILDI